MGLGWEQPSAAGSSCRTRLPPPARPVSCLLLCPTVSLGALSTVLPGSPGQAEEASESYLAPAAELLEAPGMGRRLAQARLGQGQRAGCSRAVALPELLAHSC